MSNSVFKAFTSAEMSNDEYHDPESWTAEYVSGSSLSEIQSTCAAAWRFSQKQPTKALEFGTQSHTNFESDDLFRKTYRRATKPEEVKNLITSQKALQEKLKSFGLTGTSGKGYPELIKMMADCGEDLNVLWLIEMIEESQARAEGVKLVKAEDYDACVRMRQVLEAIPEHNACMNSATAQRELSIFGEIAGVKVKVRLDHVDVVKGYTMWERAESGEMVPTTHPEVVVITDYKTTQSANPVDFNNHAARLGYYLKMALQRDLFVKAFSEKRPVIVRLLAQEKKEPFIPLAFRMNDQQLRIGRLQYMKVLTGFASWKKHDVWPSYCDNAAEVEMVTPAWIAKQYENAGI